MKSNPFQGRYLFHLHTNFTDGQLTPEAYFRFARENAVQQILFLEHIRRTPEYDVEQLTAEIDRLSTEYALPTWMGFEAKVLPDGTLDISSHDLHAAEIIGVAEHGFPNDERLWKSALERVLDELHEVCATKPVVWVHPGLWLAKRGVVPHEHESYLRMLRYAQERGIRIEANRRYGLISSQALDWVDPSLHVMGLDAHAYCDLETWNSWGHSR